MTCNACDSETKELSKVSFTCEHEENDLRLCSFCYSVLTVFVEDQLEDMSRKLSQRMKTNLQ